MINLLPNKYKQELKLRFLERKIIAFAGFLSGLILLLIICLGCIYLVLYLTQIKQSSGIFQQAHGLEQQVSSLNQELSSLINQRIERIDQIQKKQIYWSQILEKLAQITPNGVRLESLETSDNQVQMSGYAQTRDLIVSFQQILQQESQFIEIDSPLSNFVKQKDLDFYFSFKIK